VTRAYVGLGSNLGDREELLRAAVRALDAEAAIDVVAVSSFSETDPTGYLDQPRFVNAVAAVETSLAPRELLDRLLAIEAALGRRRDGPRQGPRTIDLDLLLYGDEVVDEPGLQVPHPRLHERRFALEPLAELAPPGLEVPGHGAVHALLARLD
jgi:2-amino-4-hydroxy-6-hydroxymethyldihydropteridine diphosphokinase